MEQYTSPHVCLSQARQKVPDHSIATKLEAAGTARGTKENKGERTRDWEDQRNQSSGTPTSLGQHTYTPAAPFSNAANHLVESAWRRGKKRKAGLSGPTSPGG